MQLNNNNNNNNDNNNNNNNNNNNGNNNNITIRTSFEKDKPQGLFSEFYGIMIMILGKKTQIHNKQYFYQERLDPFIVMRALIMTNLVIFKNGLSHSQWALVCHLRYVK